MVNRNTNAHRTDIAMTSPWNRGERVKTPGGLNIFFRTTRPGQNARGVLIIVPGFNAHSGYYAWAAEQLAATGFAVYAVDLRGRGNSDGERFYVNDFDDYVSDVASVVALAKSREPGLPIFLLGHSAGGVVSCLYVLEHQSEIAGLISESFAFQLPAPGFVLSAFKGISHLAPHAHILHLKNETFSRDPDVVRAKALARARAGRLIADQEQGKTAASAVDNREGAP